MNYYFLATSLPPLQIGNPPDITFQDYEILLQDNLTPTDLEKVKVLRRYHDIQNIRTTREGDPRDLRGNFDTNQLEEALLLPDGFPGRESFPPYVYAYFEKYEKRADRLKHFGELVAAFYREEAKKATGFLKWFLNFQRNLRLVLVGFRAKKLGRDLATELQFEDPEDVIVGQMMAQKDSKTFEPPEGFEDLKMVFEDYYSQPLELQKALYEYQFRKIDEKLGFDTFSIDVILGYTAKLIMVENWQALDMEKGIEIVDAIVK